MALTVQDPDRWCSHSAWGKAGMAHHQPMGVERAPGIRPSAARLRRGVPPSLPQHTSPHQISRFSHLHKGMDRSRKLCPGKLAASRGATLFKSPMAPYVARLGSPCVSTSGAERPMGACVWSRRPAFAVAHRDRLRQNRLVPTDGLSDSYQAVVRCGRPFSHLHSLLTACRTCYSGMNPGGYTCFVDWRRFATTAVQPV